MRGKFITFGLILGMVAGVSGAQVPPRTTVDPTAMYCSGAVTSDAVPQDSYVISGEQSVDKMGFVVGQLVYINRGSGQGVKVGDEFLVIRSVKDELKGQTPKRITASGPAARRRASALASAAIRRMKLRIRN